MRADVFPHVVVPVRPFVTALRAPVVQMMSNPGPASTAAEGSRQGHFFGFAFFAADFLAPFLALLFPLSRSALAAW